MSRFAALIAPLALVHFAFAQDAAPSAKTDSALHPRVKMETTLGTITLELDAEKAPISTVNFLQYCEDKFYDGKVFHRVIPDFMIQGGGYTPDMEEPKDGLRKPIFNEWRNGLKNDKYTIAMARTNQPNSATAQFFINVVDNDRLDQPISGGAAYAVFGKVVDGQDVVEKIRTTPCIAHPKYPAGGQAVTPKEPVVIKSAAPVDGASVAKVNEAIKAENDRLVAEEVKKAEAEGGKTQKTPTGLIAVIMNEGSGESPRPTDTIKCNYKGRFLNGAEFDSSRNGPATIPLTDVVKGWQEGFGLLKPGGKARLIIPGELGYPQGRRDVIPPNAIMVFDVELLEVNPQ